MKRFVPFLAAALAVAQAAELPVREVILFKHGVGFFSRAGELKAGETARLDFKASDMNDVLKSLTVEEKGGGKIVGLRYDSSEPLDKKLEQFPFEVGKHFLLSAVLDQMKGARLELKYGSEPIAGQIISASEKDAPPRKEQVMLLLDSGEMKVLDLGAASGVRFLDPVVQRQFADYLRVVAQARSKEKRSVYLDSTSAAGRSLVANYMIPSAVWKSSYRLVFGTGGATLEGWAIVDNTTDEDWSNVRLSLVSGRPISFISALYSPKYRERPTVQLREEEAVEPVVYEGVTRYFAPNGLRAGSGVPGSAGGVIGGIIGGVPSAAPPPPPPRRTMVTNSSVAVTTEGHERGELFEYRFEVPVTVKKSESAMLPFLQQKVATRKLLVYQEALGLNPRSAAEITNTSGKTLDGGPITVYDDGVYSGEALVETLKSGDKRLVSYAVDLGTRVATKIDSGEQRVRQVTAKWGEIHSRMSVESTKTYTVRNVDAKAKTLIIEHPVRSEFQLIGMKPLETTANAYRFEVALGAKATTTFVVKEESIYEDTQTVSRLAADVLLTYMSGWPLSESAKRQLTAIADRKKQIVEIDGLLRGFESDAREVTRDQERMRQNILSLNAVSGQQDQVQKYARQLADGEARLVALAEQQRDAKKRKQALEAEVIGLIERMSF